MSAHWAEVISVLEKGRRFVVTAHRNPDGDAIGSSVALVRFLRCRGKEVRLLLQGELPERYRWLLEDVEGAWYRPERDDAFVRGADVAVVLDYSQWNRIEPMDAPIAAGGAVTVGIDHHPAIGPRPKVDVVDVEAAAVGEMIFDLIRAMGGKIDLELAAPLYLAIMTDTGSFRFSNTGGRSHRLAAELIDVGVCPQQVYSAVYETSSPNRLRLLGQVLATLSTDCGGRLAWVAVTQAMVRRAQARPTDTDDFVDVVRTLQGVVLSVLFKETGTGKVKVSLRSREPVDVSRIAHPLGGGGHARAAGIDMNGTLEACMDQVLAACRNGLG
jgi:phosphoesterase RecJ-like protein